MNQKQTIIHFKLSSPVDQETWIGVFQPFFNATQAQFLTNLSGVFLCEFDIEDVETLIDEITEIASFDFSTHVQFMIGLHQQQTEETIHQEHQLFINSKSKETIVNISQTYIDQTFNNLINTPIFDSIKDLIQANDELKDCIIKLFETTGNIAQAATELYIHRNTLIYRMHKFQNDTNMDLKNPHHLLICYLITREV